MKKIISAVDAVEMIANEMIVPEVDSPFKGRAYSVARGIFIADQIAPVVEAVSRCGLVFVESPED